LTFMSSLSAVVTVGGATGGSSGGGA